MLVRFCECFLYFVEQFKCNWFILKHGTEGGGTIGQIDGKDSTSLLIPRKKKQGVLICIYVDKMPVWCTKL